MNNSFTPKNITKSCQEVLEYINFPLQIPDFLFKQLCVEATIDNSNESLFFKHHCCQNTTETTVGINEVKKFLQDTCKDANLTKDVRSEICHNNYPSLDAQEYPVSVVCLFLLCFLAPIGLISNMFIVSLVVHCKKLRNISYLFICNLAITDLLYIVAAIIYLMMVLKYINVEFNLMIDHVFVSVDVMIGSGSLLYLTAVTIERLIAITRPLQYRVIFTKRRGKITMICIWVYCVFLFIIFVTRYWVTNKKYIQVSFFVAVTISFILPCIIVILAYINIATIALQNLQSDKKVYRAIVRLSSPVNANSYKQRMLFREIKIAMNLAIITTPFIIGWGYYMIVSIYEVATGQVIDNVQYYVLNWLPFIVSCINPVVYILFTRTLRKESVKVIKATFSKIYAKKRRHSNTPTSMSSLL